jgi:hypothetical protein
MTMTPGEELWRSDKRVQLEVDYAHTATDDIEMFLAMATHVVPGLAYATAFMSAGVLVVLAGLVRQGRWNEAAGPIAFVVLLAALAAFVSFGLRDRKPTTTEKESRKRFLIDARGVTVTLRGQTTRVPASQLLGGAMTSRGLLFLEVNRQPVFLSARHLTLQQRSALGEWLGARRPEAASSRIRRTVALLVVTLVAVTFYNLLTTGHGH